MIERTKECEAGLAAGWDEMGEYDAHFKAPLVADLDPEEWEDASVYEGKR